MHFIFNLNINFYKNNNEPYLPIKKERNKNKSKKQNKKQNEVKFYHASYCIL